MAVGNIATEQTTISLPGQRGEQGQYFITSDKGVAGGASFKCYGILTGSKQVNFGYKLNVNNKALIQFFRQSDLSSIGTPMLVSNTDDNSTITSGVTMGITPIVVDVGILWDIFYVLPDMPYYSGEEWGARAAAFRLAPDTQYMVCINDLEGAANDFGIKCGWFEYD